MAGAGQPWYMPLAWPVGHISTAVMKDPQEEAPKPCASADLDMVGHLTSFMAAGRSFLLAYGAIYGMYSGNEYPAFGAGATLEVSWMVPILVRNLLATWLICGTWDWFLYFSPVSKKLAKYKFNSAYPSSKQMLHDALWTTSATLTGTAIEVALCHLWATGVIPIQATLSEAPVKSLVLALTITHWRVPHFWLIHRAMHPWKTDRVPDLGSWLYKNVHSLHHKSHNPTSWSGTSMHPVESTLYYSASLLVIPLMVHPTIVLGCIFDCAVGAWLGHDGFQWPGSGDYFHQLHHKHFDCNYGAMHFPIDKWLGTFSGGKDDLKKIWGDKEAGADANETKTH
eukprot:TRINITY_DN10226_c0_g1_i5.p1 TRINITY_DN10226_c0_g1~~TRINITY_DN10226_c0_g1_i5.p1  ORF type:complete len:339 (+),score=63.82 TRINITY_DN10226_c0_g1_i5:218-1234(+)